MFKTIKESSGSITVVNTNNITRADLKPGSTSWKIYFTSGPVLDTENFDSKEAAIKWYNDTIGKVDTI